MADIYDYLRFSILQPEAAPKIFTGFKRRAQLLATLRAEIESTLENFGVSNLVSSEEMANRFLNELIEAECVAVLEEDFAGTYLAANHPKYVEFRKKDLSNNIIYHRYQAIGSDYLRDVFAGFREKYEQGEVSLPALGMAPAANRIVTFSDNEISQFDNQISDVITSVSNQNQVDGLVGLRELMLGQLKAGRELVRAGSVRLYLLQVTLIEALRFLARRYEGELVGGLAAALITALVKHLGIDA